MRENILVALENWDRVRELAEVAGNSTGTAMKKYEAYTKSVEYAQETLTASFEEFSQKLVDTEIIKDLAELGKGGLEFLSAILEIRPVLEVLLKTTLAFKGTKALSEFILNTEKIKKLGVVKLFKDITQITKLKTEADKAAAKAAELATLAEQKKIAAEKAEQAQMEAATAKQNLISAQATGIGLAAGAVIGVISLISTAVEHYNQKLDETISKSTELSESYSSLAELTGKALGSIENATSEKTLDLQNQINEKIKDINSSSQEHLETVNLTNKSYEEQKRILDELNQKSVENSLREAKAATEAARKKANSWWNREGEGFKSLFSGANISISAKEFENSGIKWDDYASASTYLYDENAGNRASAYKKLLEMRDILLDLGMEESNLYENITSHLDATKETVGGYIQALENQAKIELQGLAVQEDYAKALAGGDEAIDAYVDNLVSANHYSKEYGDVLKEQMKGINVVEQATETYTQKVKELSGNLDSLQKAYKALTSALSEYNENGYISLDTFKSLLTDYRDYLKYLIDEKGDIKDNTTALKEALAVEAQLMAVKAAKAYVAQFEGQTEEQATAALKDQTFATEGLVSEEWDLVKAMIARLSLSKELKDQIWQYVNNMRIAADKVKIFGDGTNGAAKEEDKYAKTVQYAQSVIQKKIDALNEEKKAIQEKNEEMQKELNLYDKAISYINSVADARIKALEEEKKAIADKNAQIEKSIKLDELQRNLSKAQERNIRVYHANSDSWTWERDEVALAEAEQALKEYKIDEKIEAINKYKEAVAEIANAYEKEASEIAFLENQSYITLEGIDNLNLEEVKRFAKAYSTKQKEISKNTTDEVDKQILYWENLKSEWTSAKDKYEENANKTYAISVLGANAEEQILSGRLDVISGFTEDYTKYLSQQEKKTKEVANSIVQAYEDMKLAEESYEKSVVGDNSTLKHYSTPGLRIPQTSQSSNPFTLSNYPYAASLGTNITISNLTLPNVTDSDSFIAGVAQFTQNHGGQGF